MITVFQVFDLIHFCEESKMSLVKDTLSLSDTLYGICQKAEEKQPLEFNVISCALVGQHMKEVAHSAILANLLKHPVVREQFFLRFLKISDLDSGATTDIETEDARIDVSICSEGKYFVIIENKVNGANDQNKQIARYVQHAHEKLKFEYSQIHVVYINPAGHKQPEAQSLIFESGGSVLAEIKGNNFKILSFKEDIYEFVNSLINLKYNGFNTDVKNRLLVGGLEQYKSYLQFKFNINPDMINSITEALEKELKENQLATSFEELYRLRQRVTDILNNMHCLLWQKLKEEIINFFPSIGVQAKKHEILFVIDKNIGVRIATYHGSIYWSLYSDEPDDDTRARISKILEKSSLKSKESNSGDIFYDYFETMIKDCSNVELPNQDVLDTAKRLITACKEIVGNFSGCNQSGARFISIEDEKMLNEAMGGNSTFETVLASSERLLNLCIYIDKAITKELKTQLEKEVYEVSTGSDLAPSYDIYLKNCSKIINLWPHFPDGCKCTIIYGDKKEELQPRECPQIEEIRRHIKSLQ